MTAGDPTVWDTLREGVMYHAPVYVVVIPLLAGALAAASPSGRVGWGLAAFGAGASFLLAVLTLLLVITDGTISYALGGWEPPLGIEYRVDALNAPILVLISGVAALVMIYAPRTLDEAIQPSQQALVYCAFMIALAGLLGVAITGDAFNVFVFLEISSLATYILVAMGCQRDRRALKAAYDYLILGTIGATFFVIGVGFLYAVTGTLNIVDMADKLGGLADNRAAQTGFAFIIIGLGLKIALFPLHTWLPNAYAFAPSFFTVFVAATATKAAFIVFVRMLFGLFGVDDPMLGMLLLYLIAPLAIIGMLVCSAQACFQGDARRILAFSSVAQVGYMLLGAATGTAMGLAAGLLHLINHALMKGALFMALGIVLARAGAVRVDDFAGLGRTMPFTMAAFVLAGLSLIGVPPTAGFVSKWYLLQATLDAGWWWAAAAIAFASLLALIYVGRIIEAAYMRPPPMQDGKPPARVATPLSLLAPLWILALANLYFGLDARLTTSVSCAAAGQVYGVFETPGPDPCAMVWGASR